MTGVPHSRNTPPARGPIVQVGTVAIEYQRTGDGTPVILLLGVGNGDALGDALRGALTAQLSKRFRVLAPVFDGRVLLDDGAGPEGTRFAEWFRGFAEGLGLTHLHVVTDERLAIPMLRFALANAELVERLAIIRAGDDARVEAISDRFEESGLRLLVLDCPPGASTDDLETLANHSERFLDGTLAADVRGTSPLQVSPD